MRFRAWRRFVVLAWAAACSGGGVDSTAASATATTTDATTAASTDGVSSTSGAATTSTSTSSSAGSTATTGAMTRGESDGSSSTIGCAFLDCPGEDLGAVDCDILQQDCPEGQKCNAYGNDGGQWNDHKCVPVVRRPDDVGEPCSVEGNGVSGIDSCALGAMCWDVDPDTNMGTCVALCAANPWSCVDDPTICCPLGSSCHISADSVLILCIETCNPLVQNCQGNGEVCYPVVNSFQCAPDVSGEMGQPGDPCESINACDPGTHCGSPASYPGCDLKAGGCCVPFCDLGAPACAAGTECTPWYDPMDAPPGYEELGACVIP